MLHQLRERAGGQVGAKGATTNLEGTRIVLLGGSWEGYWGSLEGSRGSRGELGV